MRRVGVYILVKDDPYTLEELLLTLPRQQEDEDIDFHLVGLIPKMLSDASQHRIDKKLKQIHTIGDDGAGPLINRLALSYGDSIVVVLNGNFLPSNQVWLSRLTDRLEEKSADIVIGRIAHDMYTNWFIQNDFKIEQDLTLRDNISSFYFQFGNFATNIKTLSQSPFPSGAIDEFPLRWIVANPGKTRFVADAVVTYLDNITVDRFVEAYRRFSRETGGLANPFFQSLKLFFRGLARDTAFSIKQKAPQWIFFSIYLRSRQAIGFLAGAKSAAKA